MAKYYVGSIGLIIKLDTGITLAGCTLTEIHYKKPSGATGTWTASITETTKLQYSTILGDIDEAGVWEFCAYITTATGFTGPGEPCSVNFNAKWV